LPAAGLSLGPACDTLSGRSARSSLTCWRDQTPMKELYPRIGELLDKSSAPVLIVCSGFRAFSVSFMCCLSMHSTNRLEIPCMLKP
jgi:hypothetical protein